ncbi:hypothetical protein ALC57_13432 [Trachymyrmex cornetzi]|uniref:Uncharacterized protein n=1 Tax=Trachymyrmex cornetzi TaxID=471704 RepID=A0A195DMY4_9HYME|nr:hypothetical protein ALC57_13432 [Trachymyrmex cornetzi]
MAKTYTANMLASVSFLSVNLAYLHTTDLLVSNENIRKAVIVPKLSRSISRNLLYVLMNILESGFPDEFYVEIIATLANAKLEIVTATFGLFAYAH